MNNFLLKRGFPLEGIVAQLARLRSGLLRETEWLSLEKAIVPSLSPVVTGVWVPQSLIKASCHVYNNVKHSDVII